MLGCCISSSINYTFTQRFYFLNFLFRDWYFVDNLAFMLSFMTLVNFENAESKELNWALKVASRCLSLFSKIWASRALSVDSTIFLDSRRCLTLHISSTSHMKWKLTLHLLQYTSSWLGLYFSTASWQCLDWHSDL